jgi:hypothetical protein
MGPLFAYHGPRLNPLSNPCTVTLQNGEVNTYVSPDAGRTWREVAKGAHIYEFGDYGGIIVMTKHYLQAHTNEIMSVETCSNTACN